MIMSFNTLVGMVVSGFIRTMDMGVSVNVLMLMRMHQITMLMRMVMDMGMRMGVLQSNRVLDHQYSSNFLTHFLYGNHTP